MLARPIDAAGPVKIADLIEALSQVPQTEDDPDRGDREDEAIRCPHCGSARLRLVAQCPRFGVP